MALKTMIFLASSSELKAERGSLEARVNRMNKLWHNDGVFLHLEVWEDFIDAMSLTRLQDEYNKSILAADIFVLMVNTKVGKYSAEEFETAYAQFKATGRPLIFTYFRSHHGPGESVLGLEYETVRALQNRLKQLGHFSTTYVSVDGFIDHFTQQLEKLRMTGMIRGDSAPVSPKATPETPSGYIADGAAARATGKQTHINTGGGAYIGGGVTVKGGGDFVGGNKVTNGQDSTDLVAVFATLLSAMEKHAEPAVKALIAEQIEELRAEAEQPAGRRDDKRLARLVDGLVDLVPAGVAAMVSAFALPMLASAAGPATAAVLAKFRER